MTLGVAVSKLRKKTATRTDKRIRLMNEIITGISVIKMFAWENTFMKNIEERRRFVSINKNFYYAFFLNFLIQ